MAISQQDRIIISKKQITLPSDAANSLNSKNLILVEQQKALVADNVNKGIMDGTTVFIDQYQKELSQYDGNDRKSITEQNMLDSANKVKGNFMFPNDAQQPTPSLADGVWKNFVPFSKTLVIGKNYQEGYNSLAGGGELGLISSALATISLIELKSPQTRSSGDFCTTGTPDVIAPDTSMQSLAASMNGTVISIDNQISATILSIPIIYKNATMQGENTISTNNANATKAIISNWQALPDWDVIAASTCPTFDTYDVATLAPSKFRNSELVQLKNELIARRDYINNNRVVELSGYLGSISVDVKGRILSTLGWYGDRFRYIDMRLNLIAGTLSKYIGLQQGVDAQDEALASINNSQLAYDSIITTTRLKAPASGNGTIHVVDSSIFTAGDQVFLVADEKSEVLATILSISSNTIVLDSVVPKSFTVENFARIYKVI